MIQTFKIINEIDKVDKGLFFYSNLTVVVEEGIQVSCSRNAADLTFGNNAFSNRIVDKWNALSHSEY